MRVYARLCATVQNTEGILSFIGSSGMSSKAVNLTSITDVQHELNGLHVYCRLREAGVSEGDSRSLAMEWEDLIHPHLYPEKYEGEKSCSS